MKKINNKGVTSIEVLVSFIIVAVIAISMLNLIMKYKTKERIESIRENVIVYKNTVTKAIQTDIIHNHLLNISYYNTSESDGTTIYTISLVFEKPFVGGSTSKLLKIYKANEESNTSNIVDYIEYQEDNPSHTQLQQVIYKLDDYGSHDETISNTTVKKRNLRFSNISVNKNEANRHYFILDIVIFHHELSKKEHILIEVPTYN